MTPTLTRSPSQSISGSSTSTSSNSMTASETQSPTASRTSTQSQWRTPTPSQTASVSFSATQTTSQLIIAGRPCTDSTRCVSGYCAPNGVCSTGGVLSSSNFVTSCGLLSGLVTSCEYPLVPSLDHLSCGFAAGFPCNTANSCLSKNCNEYCCARGVSSSCEQCANATGKCTRCRIGTLSPDGLQCVESSSAGTGMAVNIAISDPTMAFVGMSLEALSLS